jgi:hypothetical protein
MGFVVTHRAPEQFPPFLDDALAASIGEPLPHSAAARAILTGPVWIDFDRDHSLGIGFVTGVLIDLAAQLVRTPAIHAPRFAARTWLDLAQALKEQETAGIPSAHCGDAARHLVGGIFVEPIDMPPELLVAVLAFDRLARLPLLFGNALEVPIAVSVQAMITHKHYLDDLAMLPDRDHRQILDIEVDPHGDQVRIVLALHHLAGFDLFHLGDVQFGAVCPHDQRGALALPVRFSEPLHEVVAGRDRVLHPAPSLCAVDVEAHKRFLEIECLQLECKASLIERGVIGRCRQARLALLLAACFPVRVMRQVRPDFADGILDH